MTRSEGSDHRTFGLSFKEMVSQDRRLDGQRVFLSASIPSAERWSGSFDPLAITDAVVAFARAALTTGASLVTAAHPTVAPLLLYVANEFPSVREKEPSVIVYQSRLFDDVLPRATYELAEHGIGELLWTEAASGEAPQPGRWDKSLALLRRQMLEATNPVAAVLIGGMEGIQREFDLFRDLFPNRSLYPVRQPGDAASLLDYPGPDQLAGELAVNRTYPALFRHIMDHIADQV